MERYARQRMLAAVGDQGQQRIARATYVVSADSALASSVEREYLTRAGAEHFHERLDAPAAFAHAGVFQYAAARDFAAGAWRALAQLRNALEQGQ
jgi:hypothetical protein